VGKRSDREEHLMAEDTRTEETAPESDVLGKILDTAGIIAGVFLAVIIVDMFAGGRLGKWLRGGGKGQEEEPHDG
jgi:hypothetical protein